MNATTVLTIPLGLPFYGVIMADKIIVFDLDTKSINTTSQGTSVIVGYPRNRARLEVSKA